MFPTSICTICTDAFDQERSVAAMPCGHTFHDECLLRWLENAKNCPSCRKTLRKNQQPIHRLYWDIDDNLSQEQNTSSKNCAKLENEILELKQSVKRLENENVVTIEEKFALLRSLKDKDVSLQNAIKIQDKLKKKLRDVNTDEKTIADLQEKLKHLQNVQMIVDGLNGDVAEALAERAGYTTNQITYMLLMRRQLDDSAKTSRQLRDQVNDLKQQLQVSTRKTAAVKDELEIVKVDFYHSEQQNISLKKKCDKLVKSIESPRGIAAGLAQRMVNESPAPSIFTPPPIPGSTNSGTLPVEGMITPSEQILKPSTSRDVVSSVDSSPGLFSDESDDELAEDEVKQTLFTDEPAVKKRRFANPKTSQELPAPAVSEESPFSSHPAPIKVKSTISLKVKSRVPQTGHSVRDVTNLQSRPSMAGPSKPTSSKSRFFRKGFNGMGGQNEMALMGGGTKRTAAAPRFSVFKKPAASSSVTQRNQSAEYIVID